MEKLILKKFDELTKTGELDKIVTKRVESFIDDVVRDSLSNYGDVNKLFKEQLNSKLKEGFEKMDFVQYSKTLIDLVESELNKSVIEIGIAPIKEMINRFTGSLEKKEWKLSEIIQKYIDEEVMSEEEGESGEIAFVYEVSQYGSIFVGFDESIKNRNHLYLCKYRLMINKESKKLYSPTVERKLLHPVTEVGLRGFDLFLFKLYATDCTIDCDFDNVETTWETCND